MERLTEQVFLCKSVLHEQSIALVVENRQVKAHGYLVDQTLLAHKLVEVGEHGLEVGQALHLNLEADAPVHVHHLDVDLVSPSEPRAQLLLILLPNST